MRTRVVTLMLAMAALMLPTVAQSQAAQPQTGTVQDQDANSAASHPFDGWPGPKPAAAKAQKGGPAPRHDISGTWDPGFSGLQTLGAGAIPEDGKPEHHLPYTAAGQEALSRTKPSNGARSVLPTENND